MPRTGPNRMPKGQGSVFKIKRGAYEYWAGQVKAGHYPNGKRRYVTVTRKRKTDVLAEMDELRRRAGAGIVGKDQTVAELLDEWISMRAPHLAATSLIEYQRRANAIRSDLGRIRLRKLAAADVRSMMKMLEERGVAPNTRNHIKSTLSSALSWAVGEKRISDNPAAHVEGAKLGAKLDDSLDDAEVDAVLAAASDDRLYAILYLSVTLGLRQSEALGLRWSDIDLDTGEIRIDQSKTRAGERSLPLVASTHDALREHRKRQASERLEAVRYHDGDFVFCEPDGTRLTSRDLVRWWHALQETAGITPRRRWHALRHSAVSRMLSKGVPLELASVVAGHSGIAITIDTYGRFSRDAKRRELGRYLEGHRALSDQSHIT
jgi:integrase